MAIIDGVNVARWDCVCKADQFWFFQGRGGEGVVIVCVQCGEHQLELQKELGIPYLWRNKQQGIAMNIKMG